MLAVEDAQNRSATITDRHIERLKSAGLREKIHASRPPHTALRPRSINRRLVSLDIPQWSIHSMVTRLAIGIGDRRVLISMRVRRVPKPERAMFYELWTTHARD